MTHNFFVQCFDKDGHEITPLRQSSYEPTLQDGLSLMLGRWRGTELGVKDVAAIFVSTIPGFAPVDNG